MPRLAKAFLWTWLAICVALSFSIMAQAQPGTPATQAPAMQATHAEAVGIMPSPIPGLPPVVMYQTVPVDDCCDVTDVRVFADYRVPWFVPQV